MNEEKRALEREFNTIMRRYDQPIVYGGREPTEADLDRLDVISERLRQIESARK
jgi:hypothetical protein